MLYLVQDAGLSRFTSRPITAMNNSKVTPAADRPTVLVVDDDAEIVALLERYLTGHGFQVTGAANGAELRIVLNEHRPDLVLLDLSLPGEDGLSILRYLQATWGGPVIVISGRSESVERVVGLELGADDYVTKPFDFRELLARIRSVLRRTASDRTSDDALRAPSFRFDGLTLDLAARNLIDRDGSKVALTTSEFDLLKALLDRPMQVLTRDQLMNNLYSRDSGPFDRAIDVGIGRLRRKIERDPAAPLVIKSVRGAGYVLSVEVSRS